MFKVNDKDTRTTPLASNAGKIRTRITTNTNAFYTVAVMAIPEYFTDNLMKVVVVVNPHCNK